MTQKRKKKLEVTIEPEVNIMPDIVIEPEVIAEPIPEVVIEPEVVVISEPEPEILMAVAPEPIIEPVKLESKPLLNREMSKLNMLNCIDNELNYVTNEALINERTKNYKSLLTKFKEKIQFDNY